ncbi:dimethylamine monooxygenase subunit DmmA family protein [Nocardioides bruguierae]|uniref:Dimethylamine monooxygenase subunit DmmA-like C-terminal domain-containing protein n=1 Tax=Nocardioides bruguierae TaxID=2945102 RepID=A0A9X2IEF3_9ACTN|nr:dimethylamine monooxygenase subunit DmmA family protein [Nocardioides bruguierae]MCM0620766.1 hypothetical protein [Nocardioides bruguierae]
MTLVDDAPVIEAGAEAAPVAEPPLGVPRWLREPEPLDAHATVHLVVACGSDPRTADVAAGWAAQATAAAPVRVLALPQGPVAGREVLDEALASLRTGARVLVAGDRHDVLVTLSAARAAGAGPDELRCFAVDAYDGTGPLPVFCAHCRATRRMIVEPGGEVACPGCARHLEVHPHHSAALGAFLASDARARDLA